MVDPNLISIAVGTVPRALSLLDKTMGSPTYGSGDRPFWRYRTLVDFPGAIWQQPMLGLLILHDLEVTENHWYNDPRLIEASRSLLCYWIRLQHSSGTFDEWYRNEQSYCPTAFTAAVASLTLRRLGPRLPESDIQLSQRVLLKCAEWLAVNDNSSVGNQNLAAVVALFAIANLVDSNALMQKAEKKLLRVLATQNPDGWFPEYSGVDFGYTTLALDLLALADMAGAKVLPAAERLAVFLEGFVAPDGTYPGRIGSRGSCHSFGFGLIHFSNIVPAAQRLASRWLKTRLQAVSLPQHVDDRYFAYFYFNAFALAAEATNKAEWDNSPSTLDTKNRVRGSLHVQSKSSGLAISTLDEMHVVYSAHCGGLAIWVPGLGWHYHLGYRIIDSRRRHLVSGLWNTHSAIHSLDSPWQNKNRFCYLSTKRPLDRMAIPFRLATALYRYQPLAAFAQRRIKKWFISSRAGEEFILERRVELQENYIVVNDTIQKQLGTPVVLEVWPCVEAPVHSPSAQQDYARGLIVGNWNERLVAQKINDSNRWQQRFYILRQNNEVIVSLQAPNS